MCVSVCDLGWMWAAVVVVGGDRYGMQACTRAHTLPVVLTFTHTKLWLGHEMFKASTHVHTDTH